MKRRVREEKRTRERERENQEKRRQKTNRLVTYQYAEFISFELDLKNID